MANWPNWLPIKESLRDNKVYGAPQIQDVIKLNTNENPYQLPKSVITELTNEIEIIAKNLNRYPERDAIKLRSALAEYLSKDFLTAENIWAANGSNEILQQIFLAYANSSCVGLSPSYSVHPLIAKMALYERSPIFRFFAFLYKWVMNGLQIWTLLWRLI
ncbi:MAG: hypothetical protein EB157_05130 [Euryarchaeota archaeon]|nr:hypothetical protein [Euryarchaeota archaeon]